MSYKNKTYIAFDADTDMKYYRLMTAWKENENIDFNFHNAHELNNLRSTSSEETIKGKLRERLNNTKIMIVLMGEKTKVLYKFVRWEMEVAINMDIPIIGVNLNGKKGLDNERCPAIIKDVTKYFIPFKLEDIKNAMDKID